MAIPRLFPRAEFVGWGGRLEHLRGADVLAAHRRSGAGVDVPPRRAAWRTPHRFICGGCTAWIGLFCLLLTRNAPVYALCAADLLQRLVVLAYHASCGGVAVAV